MSRKFIPIIGTISAGKSTFLQGLLGTSVLERGPITTTKFVCLIQNSAQTKFYHVLPKKENSIQFIKEGNEITGEKNIKNKIKEINKAFSEKPGTKDEIFYKLEIPIKNIENVSLLEECYFMDIPGLNEKESSYIEIIFSLLTLDDIKFEIIVFDSTSIGSDNILNIINRLDKKKCLKKRGNLLILNRIDQIAQNREKEIIEGFKQYFYQNFEDDKKDDLILINISENHFVPMNSLSFVAESKINEDFYSMLLVEFFDFLESKEQGQVTSFYEYLLKKLEFTLNWLKEKNKQINLDVKSITKEEMNIIEDSVKDLDEMKKKSYRNCLLNIKLTKENIKNDMIKLFLIHKNKYTFYIRLKYYDEIHKIMKSINTNEDLFSPSLPPNIEIKPIKSVPLKPSNNMDLEALNELENFINETFKKIDPMNELESFKISLQNLRESIIGRKIRIAFIGNISVGKSSVINSLIGTDILPINDKECTYRGILIRHKEGESFKLYKTKLEKKGKGNDEYYYFIDDKHPYRQSVEEIHSYLSIKNNDKDIADKDAFIVITGHLKIFDFIKLDKEIISKIEFIDLPGTDRENNEFNKKQYYKKILRFTNCCVYINEPKTIEDEKSVGMIKAQYQNDKQKIFPKLRMNFIKTCLFLINKSDIISNDEEKEKLKNNIIKNIGIVEKEININNINISFFSGKFFLEYLKVSHYYINCLEQKPGLFIFELYNKYKSKLSNFFLFKSFKSYIMEKISKIEENFFLDEEENEEDEEEEPPENFSNPIKHELQELEKNNFRLISSDDYDEVIQSLYKLNKKLKNKDFSKTYYSHNFFNDLKKAIENSEKLNKENFRNNVKSFFRDTDILFRKELKKESEDMKDVKQKEVIRLGTIYPIISETFDATEKEIKSIFKKGKEKIKALITDEIDNISDRLKTVNKDIKVAKDKLKTKIDTVIEDMKSKQKELFGKLIKEIEDKIQKKFKEKEMKIYTSDIDTNKGLTVKMILSLITSTIAGIGIRMGLVYIGEFVLAGAAAGVATTTAATAIAGAIVGPLGIAIGVGVGIAISLTTLLVHVFSTTKRYEKGLKDFKAKIEENLNESENNFLDDFRTFTEDFNFVFKQQLAAVQKEITNIDKEEWKDLQIKYAAQKDKIMKIIGIFEID